MNAARIHNTNKIIATKTCDAVAPYLFARTCGRLKGNRVDDSLYDKAFNGALMRLGSRNSGQCDEDVCLRADAVTDTLPTSTKVMVDQASITSTKEL